MNNLVIRSRSQCLVAMWGLGLVLAMTACGPHDQNTLEPTSAGTTDRPTDTTAPVSTTHEPLPEDTAQPNRSLISPKTEGYCTEKDIGLFHSNAHFTDVWRQCGKSEWGDAMLTDECIRKGGYGELSPKCGSCFGEFSKCGYKNCKLACLFRGVNSQACKDCGRTNCGAEWERCSGASLDSLAE